MAQVSSEIDPSKLDFELLVDLKCRRCDLSISKNIVISSINKYQSVFKINQTLDNYITFIFMEKAKIFISQVFVLAFFTFLHHLAPEPLIMAKYLSKNGEKEK